MFPFHASPLATGRRGYATAAGAAAGAKDFAQEELFARTLLGNTHMSHYQVLGLPEPVFDLSLSSAEAVASANKASSREIRHAYYKLSMRFHPDRLPAAASAAWGKPAYTRITDSYATLANPDTRAAYDQSIFREASTRAAALTSSRGRQYQFHTSSGVNPSFAANTNASAFSDFTRQSYRPFDNYNAFHQAYKHHHGAAFGRYSADSTSHQGDNRFDIGNGTAARMADRAAEYARHAARTTGSAARFMDPELAAKIAKKQALPRRFLLPSLTVMATLGVVGLAAIYALNDRPSSLELDNRRFQKTRRAFD
ncbi:hypothetical protein H696_02564 [Fonticula alba]|uniref:J domain-containing protein n=1 Tax=Fonticula alba TaxID=691883 RepID=A0A058Z7F7_FONAL|nr:hypothetical protein H696_02564 [Fonticula alba]KCV70234.1 hypothetical protein H696_02564 [Fonticula alba]|eukprot:XP_009494750.1 hypothetical protein H696_02564 [Fonticula alba]